MAATKLDTAIKVRVGGAHTPALIVGVGQPAQCLCLALGRAGIACEDQCLLVLLKAAFDVAQGKECIAAQIMNLRADHSATNYQVSAASESSSVAVTGSVLTDNVATERGGGLIVGGGSTLTLNTTVVPGNVAPQGREAVVQPGSIVAADNANTIGYGGNAGIVGFTLGPSDTIAAQPPLDPTLEELAASYLTGNISGPVIDDLPPLDPDPEPQPEPTGPVDDTEPDDTINQPAVNENESIPIEAHPEPEMGDGGSTQGAHPE